MHRGVRTDLLVYRRRPWGARIGAVAVAVGLHAALIVPMTLGASAKLPSRQGESAAVSLPEEGSVATIVFLDPSLLSRDEGISAPGDAPKAPKADDLTPRLVRFDVTLPRVGGDFERSRHPKTSTDDVDGAQQALLFGRYVNQIVARIDRAWVRPDTAPAGVSLWSGAPASAQASADARFNCRAQILQSTTGAVLQVTLLDCDADPKWQQSLVDAIDAASPMPAPPAESVFARSIVINFTSAAAPRAEKTANTEAANQSEER